jgi:hypothetical protein
MTIEFIIDVPDSPFKKGESKSNFSVQTCLELIGLGLAKEVKVKVKK